MDDRDRAYEVFVAACNGDATLATLEAARRGKVAVAWIDRSVVERHLGDALTEQEWGRLVFELPDYDEHVTETSEVEGDFIDSILKKANIERD